MLAKKIASKPPLAVRMMKRAVYQGQTSSLRAHLDYISSQLSLLSVTRDHREAAQAVPGEEKTGVQGRVKRTADWMTGLLADWTDTLMGCYMNGSRVRLPRLGVVTGSPRDQRPTTYDLLQKA